MHGVYSRIEIFIREGDCAMFTESLLESSGVHQHTRRGWTTAASLAVQAIVIGMLALIPMLYPSALSLVRRPPDVPIFSVTAAPPPVATQASVPSAAQRQIAIPVR